MCAKCRHGPSTDICVVYELDLTKFELKNIASQLQYPGMSNNLRRRLVPLRVKITGHCITCDHTSCG